MKEILLALSPMHIHTPTQLAGLGFLKGVRLISHLSNGPVPLGAGVSLLFAKWDGLMMPLERQGLS